MYKKIKYSQFLKVSCISFIAFIAFQVNAQNDTLLTHRNAIFFEIGGAGGSHSMNFERAFNIKPDFNGGLRIGFGFENLLDYNGKFNPNIVIPVMAGLMYGKKHKLELGLGQTFSNIVESSSNTGDPVRRSNFSTTFNIGYRFQNPKNGMMFRAGYTPYIEFNQAFKNWFGLSIGYTF